MVIVVHIGLMLSVLLLGAVQVLGQEPKPQPQQAVPTAHTSPLANKNQPSEGERKFQINCGRCHNPPEQLSPRIAGTVLRHMRVRAMLSPEDAREILEYLAP